MTRLIKNSNVENLQFVLYNNSSVKIYTKYKISVRFSLTSNDLGSVRLPYNKQVPEAKVKQPT